MYLQLYITVPWEYSPYGDKSQGWDKVYLVATEPALVEEAHLQNTGRLQW